jgi:hypothetical protein
MSTVREKLESFGKNAWVPILAVSCLSLLVGYCNYYQPVGYLPPSLEFANGDVDVKSRFLRLYFQNRGGANAWDGKVALFIEGEKRPFAETVLAGAGDRVLRGYGGLAEFYLANEIPNRFLACATYSDSGRSFAQAFLLALRIRSGSTFLIEEAKPKDTICR